MRILLCLLFFILKQPVDFPEFFYLLGQTLDAEVVPPLTRADDGVKFLQVLH